MFTYKFSEENRKTPPFELDGVPLRMSMTAAHLCIEYCGKSYRDVECEIDLQTGAQLFSCRFAFCHSSRWLEILLKDTEPTVRRVTLGLCRAKEPSGRDLPGLPNLGATCYINSLLQSLYHLPGFRNHVYGSDGYYSLLFQRLFYRMDTHASLEEGDLYDAVASLIRNLSFVESVNTHQDVHEFSKMLFDRLESENKALKGFIEGRLMNVIECGCGCVSTRGDPFQDLQLPLNDAGAAVRDMRGSLEVFCREESLSGYRCEKHGPTKAKRRVLFGEMPEVLFVLVNRFNFDWENDNFEKNNEFFAFPEQMDFGSYLYSDKNNNNSNIRDANISSERDTKQHKKGNKTNEHNYSLYGVIVHSGVVEEGHFYCYLRKEDGLFYKFNDNFVYQCAKEEAIDWNFGGSYAHSNKEKNFSAYYLIYRRDGSQKEQGPPNTAYLQDQRVTAPRAPVVCRYLTNSSLLGYSGLGRFNVSDPRFPMIVPSTENILELDNLSKVFVGRHVYDEAMELKTDSAVDPNKVYFLSDAKSDAKQRLVFIKVYEEAPWCCYPTSLHSLGAFPLKSLEDLKKFVDYDDFAVYKEECRCDCANACECDCKCNADNNGLDCKCTGACKCKCINNNGSISNSGVSVINDFDQIKHGDIIIIAKGNLGKYLEEYKGHQLVNVFVDHNFVFSVFVSSGLSLECVEKKIQEFVGSDEIFLIGQHGEGTAAPLDAPPAESSSPPVTPTNVDCLLNTGSLFYVGVQNSTDINNIEHVHAFLLPAESTAATLIHRFRLSRFICMTRLQALDDLQVVESFKKSTNARILDDNDVLVPHNSLLCIQERIKAPLRISFYVDCYKLINYPFFIENPGSVQALRERFFFVNKIVRFNGTTYVECSIGDSLALEGYEILLIEQKHTTRSTTSS